jgi:hydroxyacylglutathione hydrolase
MKILEDLYGFIWADNRTNNCNTYLIKGSKKILIDPGHKNLFDHVRKELGKLNLTPEEIDIVIVTHGHPDHLEMARMFGKSTRIAMGLVEYQFIQEYYRPYMELPEPDFFLKNGELAVGDHVFQILETPGHSPGSICIYWPLKKALFTGDVVFKQGVGRTDLGGGEGRLLKESILRLSNLNVEVLLPGHGDVVHGGKAVMENFEFIKNNYFSYL